MSSQSQNPFTWRHFQADILLLCVRWYQQKGGLTNFLMGLHKRIDGKGREVGKVYPFAGSFLNEHFITNARLALQANLSA